MTDLDFPLLRISSAKSRDALIFAEQKHRGVTRKGLDVPYVLHPVQVAVVVAGVGGDRNDIVAALLHDVLEDTDATYDELCERYGKTVADIVWAVTKSKEFKGLRLEAQAGLIIVKLEKAGLPAHVVKGADVLVNISDVVFDYEERGIDSLIEVFVELRRVPRKLAHYLELGNLIADRLDGTPFERLSVALRGRMTELRRVREETLTYMADNDFRSSS